MIKFEFELLEAPGVRDPVLAATWARLAVRTRSESGEVVLTRAENRNQAVQDGVYVSLFPLAEWIVENWWFLLHEPVRSEHFGGGRQIESRGRLADWVRRHNLLAAREGMSLPDLTLFRDADHIAVLVYPDPVSVLDDYPVRFIAHTDVQLDRNDVIAELHHLIAAVLNRIEMLNHDDADRLRTNWAAIMSADADEAYLASSAAMMGLDFYDEQELTDDVAEILERELATWHRDLRDDLLESTRVQMLKIDLKWVERSAQQLDIAVHANSNRGATEGGRFPRGARAYQVGYDLASQFRDRFGLPESGLGDLDRLLFERLEWSPTAHVAVPRPRGSRLRAVVGTDIHGAVRVATSGGPVEHDRFALARALFFVENAGGKTTNFARMVTSGFDWDQSASRAFAAELLAPANALRTELDTEFDEEDVDRLADKYNVSSWVIKHQIDNHGLLDDVL